MELQILMFCLFVIKFALASLLFYVWLLWAWHVSYFYDIETEAATFKLFNHANVPSQRGDGGNLPASEILIKINCHQIGLIVVSRGISH